MRKLLFLFVLTLSSFSCFGQDTVPAQYSLGNMKEAAGASSPYFDDFDVMAFCASGSQTTTTGSIKGGTSALELARAIDFAACPPGSGEPGEGITIYHAGPLPAISAPTHVTATVVGSDGKTTHTYQIAANDYFGGALKATTAVAVTTANATLSSTNYVNLCFTPGAGDASYSIYRDGAYLVTTFDTTPPSLNYCYEDTGYNANGQGWGNSTTTKPDWLSSTPGAAVNDWCQTTIASGAGTTSLKLATPCPSSATGQIVKHDDTRAFQAAANAAGAAGSGTIYVPRKANPNVSYVNWPTNHFSRGWIILDIEGQITITYPLTFGTPTATGFSQNAIRITGGTSSSPAGSQFPSSNTGHIYSGFVSPVIHTVYQNNTALWPLIFDHLGIYNRGIGGGDGIVVDGGNSGGTYINNVDVATTGTPLRVGYGGANASLGPCTIGSRGVGGFGLHVDHSTLTAYYNGNPLTNCDGWLIDEAMFGMAYFDTITLIGQGIHTVGMGTTDWDHIFQESGTTIGFITWDTGPNHTCTPVCGPNSFRHIELADPVGSANSYFVYTINGSSYPSIGQISVDMSNIAGVAVAGGTTPIAACNITQNGATWPSFTPGSCAFASGTVNGKLLGTGGGSGLNMPPNMTSGSGLNNFYSLDLGPVAGVYGNVLAMQGPIGFTGDYLDILDPSSTVISRTRRLWIDSNYDIHAPGFINTQFTGTTSTVGGSLSAGGCATGTVAIKGASTTMAVVVSPAADPGAGFTWGGFVSAAGTVTVRLCNNTAASATPRSTTYNVRVIQ